MRRSQAARNFASETSLPAVELHSRPGIGWQRREQIVQIGGRDCDIQLLPDGTIHAEAGIRQGYEGLLNGDVVPCARVLRGQIARQRNSMPTRLDGQLGLRRQTTQSRVQVSRNVDRAGQHAIIR